MRIWGVDPSLMCQRHILGEHREMHALVVMIRLGTKKSQLEAHCRLGQVAIHQIVDRHELLVEEMERRGWNHKTPMGESERALLWVEGEIDSLRNLSLLSERCPLCREKN